MNRPAAILLASILLASPASLRAQGGSDAQSTFLDPSIAVAGMGRAGASVFWSEFPNGWANPALLGYHRGIRYAYGKTRLVPDLADNVWFRTHEITIGGGGIGVSLAGKPVEAIGHLRLDYGLSEATDADGNPIGTFDSYERIDQFSVGANLVETFETIRRLTGHEPSSLSRRVDLSIGHTWKNVTVDLAPAFVTIGGIDAKGEAPQRDWGALLRVTPIDGFPRDGSGGQEGLSWRLQVAGGYSRRNYAENGGSWFLDEDADIHEERLLGGSARVAVRFPGATEGGFWNFAEPTLALGLTMETANYYQGGSKLEGLDATRSGQELAIYETLFLRHGFVDEEAGYVHDDSWGVGVRLRYKKMVGFTYDWADSPQSEFLHHIERQAVTFFVDPLRLLRTLR
ncbi:MAG TPA: hypothetical protein VFS09_12730 [Candidatus Eisenbacteria bacterium]|nr:hypothetical protein [Candidatus Eisenbacteria bacterium]